MNLEETKKIIQNKIEAEALTRNVRSQIKSYIDQKQNLREGFKETFQPLIESQDKVKESIDNQQNAMIKQLQENQFALTEGLDKNRLAITSGFDKMEEVKRCHSDQLPGFEAIEHPEEIEKEPLEAQKSSSSLDESALYMITHRVLNKLIGEEIYPNDNDKEIMTLKDISNIYRKSPIDKSRYNIRFSQRTKEVLIDDKKPNITTVTYGKDEMDKHLNKTETVDLLDFYGLKLPRESKDKSMEEFQEAFDKGMDETANLKKSIKNVAYYKKDSDTGLILAFPKAGENAIPKSKELINAYNIMQIFINNMGQLRNYKKLTGTGIIHFNNPLQLFDRLELLIGSLNAGSNGVKQEFTQIVHLLHQLKVITKKQLNDLLKKYILNK